MEMSQIRYILAAVRTLNFTRAAAECQVSQPALTKAIRSLEDELGGLLFHRDGRRVLLSDLGRSMIPHLQQIADRAELARSVADNFRLLDKVPIRLGVMSTIGPVRLSRMLGRFQQDHEGVEVAVHEGSIADLKSHLEEGELDLALLNPLQGLGSGFHADPLYEERYVVIFPPGHRLAEKNGIALGELSGEAYVDRLACEMREMVMGLCRDCQVELYARFRSEREDWIQAIVLAQIGFAFMPEYSVTLPELSQRPLVDPAVARKIALVSVPGRRHSPAVAAFARAAKSFSWPG
jgi:DNA-binding transcriptional LysR family regulator